jgi:hypothetical protein
MKLRIKHHGTNLCLITLFILSFCGCKKLVDVQAPGTRIASDNVFNSDATAIAVLNGLYTKLSSTNYSSNIISIPTISMWAGLSADELSLWSGANSNMISYYRNDLAANTTGSEFWSSTYPLIYICNSTIEGLNNSTSLTPAVKQQLLGEAKFMRAFFYFYLVNLYGDVPLVLSTDYTINSLLSRTSQIGVYQQVITDLKEAQDLLANGYVKADGITLYSPSSAERIRPCKAAAATLLAKTYLFVNDWQNAEIEATSVINNNSLYDTVSLNKVFLKNSKEAIWQLQPVTNAAITNTAEGVAFVLSLAPTGVNSSHPVYLSSSLLNSFELGDQRKTNGNWINVYSDASGTYYYPFKYKISANGAPVTEYTMILRLGELYLIRAEARAQQGNISGAQADLNVIRERAGLNNTTANDKNSLLTAILHERQIELFTELGNRWLDLKRTTNIDAKMTSAAIIKNSTWRHYQALYPLPANDILRDPNLDQNSGY